MAVSPTTSSAKTTGSSDQNYSFAFSTLTVLFFMWGFLTALNDILIPHLKAVFELSYVQASLIQFTFFSAYFIMSLPSGKIVEKVGYKNGIVIGLGTASIGAFLFYPAASLPSYSVFLAALFILATGVTILQVAANPYVSVLGKPETASSRLNLSQAFNSLGTTLAPAFGGFLILSVSAISVEAMASMSESDLKIMEASSVQMPYLGLGITLLVMAIIFSQLKLPTIESVESEDNHSFLDAIKVPHLALAALAIFMYVGAEVSIGSYLINFIAELNIDGFPTDPKMAEKAAAPLVSLFWGGAMIGRFLGSISMSDIEQNSKKLMYSGLTLVFAAILAWVFTNDFMNTLIFVGFVIGNYVLFQVGKGMPNNTLGILALTAASFALLSIFLNGMAAVWTILSIGLFNSIMFPTIFTLGIKDLGTLTGKGSSLLIMAIVGGAIIPVMMGFLADSIGIHSSFFLPAICYAYIAFFGFKGALIRKSN